MGRQSVISLSQWQRRNRVSKNPDKCPVCDMTVKFSEFTCQYHKMYFYFCSKQCLDNFNDRPGLYIRASIKNAGELIKNRVIPLAEPLSVERIELVKSVLLKMMGVNKVIINIKNIHVIYDLKQVKEIQIEDALSEIEIEIKNNLFESLRRRHIQQCEENELDNLASSPRSCCNKTPPGA